ncbi:MerR family transcriptional regulator [Streptomyces sp. HUAS 31]|uniref:MerR family transcriptional regulator n=1 Tax=Streptomyces TaxID=1883 RepID=UPI00230637CD|nr:MerR family transcriptional regulator [Streptomyces sp. HUAS 31]WCD94457.1 MerR family transcriptional regulator [Streptomyces sp. HUAS 31]
MSEASSGARPVPLRTVDVARASGYSVQQVRDMERLGVIPPAARSANGYRTYASVHVHALAAYRGLASAVGPVTAREVLSRVRTQPLAEAASAISELHVRLAREREEALRAQQALRAIRDEETPEVELDGDAMTITQLAGALNVRPSTLRFWEEEGLVVPERVTSLRARRYGLPAIRAARIVAALRNTGHGIPAVREIVDSLHRLDGREETRRILSERLDRIAARTVALLRAGADLAAVITSRESPGPPRGETGAGSGVSPDDA